VSKATTSEKQLEKQMAARLKQMRYVAYLPRKLQRGTLCHNSIRHTLDMPPGVNGFRAWFEDKPPAEFKPCRCGWSGLPHFSAWPNYKCETLDALNLTISDVIRPRARSKASK
jgi:hypothetical protein